MGRASLLERPGFAFFWARLSGKRVRPLASDPARLAAPPRRCYSRPVITRFRIELDMFRGPLDLLLYLVRKHELDIVDIPIAPITDQFLGYIAILEQIDVNAVGDFLEMASTLIEIKSREVLPGEEEVEQELIDPRQELVRRLLAYKQYRDAASMLEERGREWRERFPRVANDLPAAPRAAAWQPIQEVELWDLVSAFGRVLKEKFSPKGPENIRYDDTPIHVYMQQIDERLRRDGRSAFTTFFESAVHKSALVGMFLAVLELVRHQHARAEQPELFGEIWLEPGDTPLPADAAASSNYEHAP
jgi:segregation and condensation protein A